ncbi:MAG TPA: hypothetical protein VGQ22_24495 [Steroidobacteraceae bacterium]|jgi:probable HAF family extracellular repeat protein|nr:hypothetical protein [Steroidobacteraceae bacterium]
MTRSSVSVATLAFFLAATSSIAAQAGDVRYQLTQIVPDAPTSSILAFDLNNRDQVVGNIQDVNGRARPFTWRNGTLTDLGPLVAEGSPQSRGIGLNDHGDIVGFFLETQNFTGVTFLLSRKGEVTHVDGLPGATDTGPQDINDRGQILALSSFEDGSSQSFISEDGNAMPLPPLAGDTSATAAALNERGDALGTSVGATGHVVIWEDGAPVDLNVPRGIPRDLNDREQVVGTLSSSQGSSGFLWERGTVTQLPSLDGAVRTQAVSINNAAEIVGQSALDSGPLATLWKDEQVFDLNDLILGSDPQQPFVHLETADLINDRGAIVATGRDSRFPSELRTYLLTPVL